MRTRERNNLTTVPLTSTATIRTNNETSHSCGTAYDGRTSGFAYPIGSYETITDQVIPGFKARSAKGEIFNNPMSSYKETRSVERGTSSVRFAYKATDSMLHRHCPDHYWESVPEATVCLVANGGPVSHLVQPNSASRNMRDYAGTLAYADIDSPTVDGATFIAELRETISFVRNPLKAFVGLVKAAKTSKSRNAAKRALTRRGRPVYNRDLTVYDYIVDNWLSYRYGFRPIVKDIEDAAEAVAQTVLNERPKRRTARGNASDSSSLSNSGTCPYDSRCEFQTDTRVSVEVRAGVLYEYQRSRDTFGVDFARVPVAAWEAIPFSFVVDHFLNVGSFIEGITPKGGIKHLAAWTTTTVTLGTTRTSRLVSVPVTSGRVGYVVADGLTTESFNSVSKTRIPGVTIGLAMRNDPFLKGNSLDTDKSFITDLVALGSQLLRSK